MFWTDQAGSIFKSVSALSSWASAAMLRKNGLTAGKRRQAPLNECCYGGCNSETNQYPWTFWCSTKHNLQSCLKLWHCEQQHWRWFSFPMWKIVRDLPNNIHQNLETGASCKSLVIGTETGLLLLPEQLPLKNVLRWYGKRGRCFSLNFYLEDEMTGFNFLYDHQWGITKILKSKDWGVTARWRASGSQCSSLPQKQSIATDWWK